jgi:hypothetical protein
MATPPSDRVAHRSPAFWVVVVVVVLFNIWFDYYHPLGIILDVALALAVLIRYVSKSE